MAAANHTTPDGVTKGPPQGWTRIYARRLTSDDETVDLLVLHPPTGQPRCIGYRTNKTLRTDTNRLARLLNAAATGEGTEIPLSGFPRLNDKKDGFDAHG